MNCRFLVDYFLLLGLSLFCILLVSLVWVRLADSRTGRHAGPDLPPATQACWTHVRDGPVARGRARSPADRACGTGLRQAIGQPCAGRIRPGQGGPQPPPCLMLRPARDRSSRPRSGQGDGLIRVGQPVARAGVSPRQGQGRPDQPPTRSDTGFESPRTSVCAVSRHEGDCAAVIPRHKPRNLLDRCRSASSEVGRHDSRRATSRVLTPVINHAFESSLASSHSTCSTQPQSLPSPKSPSFAISPFQHMWTVVPIIMFSAARNLAAERA